MNLGGTMYYRCFTSSAALAVLVVVSAAGQALSPAAKTTASGKTWTAPRTPDGHRDFQGVWTNNTVTPLERSKGLGAKEFYTEAELAEKQKWERERLDLNLEEGRPTEAGTAEDVHYDFAQFGLDRGQAKLFWDRRPSILVRPERTTPPLKPEAPKRSPQLAPHTKTNV